MDLSSSKFYQSPSLFAEQEDPQELEIKGNPFEDTFSDPVCKLNLKETAEFVRSFPMGGTQKRREIIGRKSLTEAPSTPGRPVFSFSVPRKGIPSKWDDAEKWLIGGGGSCNESPANPGFRVSKQKGGSISKPFDGNRQKDEIFEEKVRVFEEEKVSSLEHHNQHHHSFGAFHGAIVPADVPLKDKFTNGSDPFEPDFEYFSVRNQNPGFETMKDVGTEMTPLGSSTTSRCHTPFKSTSPARHNTPATRSGPLVALMPSFDITSQLQECHLAKLQNGSTQFDSVTTKWSSKEEEEEEISKSLRHFEIGRRSVSVSESRACAWEDEEKSKACLRYQREEAKIRAWVNLQSAKAEAQSLKLEVKIEKMRSELEEKLMKRMAEVHKKAEEWRAAAQLAHSTQIHRAADRARKLINRQNSHLSVSCGCFPCNNIHP